MSHSLGLYRNCFSYSHIIPKVIPVFSLFHPILLGLPPVINVIHLIRPLVVALVAEITAAPRPKVERLPHTKDIQVINDLTLTWKTRPNQCSAQDRAGIALELSQVLVNWVIGRNRGTILHLYTSHTRLKKLITLRVDTLVTVVVHLVILLIRASRPKIPFPHSIFEAWNSHFPQLPTMSQSLTRLLLLTIVTQTLSVLRIFITQTLGRDLLPISLLPQPNESMFIPNCWLQDKLSDGI